MVHDMSFITFGQVIFPILRICVKTGKTANSCGVISAFSVQFLQFLLMSYTIDSCVHCDSANKMMRA